MEVVHTKVMISVIGFLVGAILGSFAKAIADRSLTKKSFWGRSYCTHCQNKLRWYDLFPIFSYIFLRGKCRYCKKTIKIEYLFVEVVMGLLIAFLFWQSFHNFSAIDGPAFGWQFSFLIFELLLKTFFITILAILFITDIKDMFIPDRVILPSLLIGVVATFILTLVKIGYLYYFLTQSSIGKYLLPPNTDYFQRHALITAQPFFESIAMGLLIGGFFWALIIITKGKGMGGGDVKLGAFMGLMLGFPQSLLALVLSFISGAILSIILIFFGKKHFGQVIPFGPFLVFGSLIALFWGNLIIDWYLHLGF